MLHDSQRSGWCLVCASRLEAEGEWEFGVRYAGGCGSQPTLACYTVCFERNYWSKRRKDLKSSSLQRAIAGNAIR